ncbi:HIT-like protein [Exidia glandulosa HHB12029]|uniref:HIT-like protein n=1 Tax=Exidia glandulosa HHB12029 TaxID=1314781 RepID=A0A165P1M1_EXIGL|nr:HIT-like protein [Exidia glandulosa HHB12029]
MTSFIIQDHVGREPAPSWAASADDGCVFCNIVAGKQKAFRIYENDFVLAFLDILPLRPGHLLVVPKFHCKRLSDLPPAFAGAVGEALARVSHALTQAMDNTGLNVVCNQEYAQAVAHVHFHVVPAPILNAPHAKSEPVNGVLDHKAMLKFEKNAREELDESEGEIIAERIRSRL